MWSWRESQDTDATFILKAFVAVIVLAAIFYFSSREDGTIRSYGIDNQTVTLGKKGKFSAQLANGTVLQGDYILDTKSHEGMVSFTYGTTHEYGYLVNNVLTIPDSWVTTPGARDKLPIFKGTPKDHFEAAEDPGERVKKVDDDGW